MRLSSIQKYLINSKVIPYALSILFLVITIFLGISVGSISISFSTILHIMTNGWISSPIADEISPMVYNIVVSIRMPRVLLAMLVGFSLAIAGASFQGLLKNPLADPYTLGVSSGASVGAVIVLFLGLTLPVIGSFTLPIMSIMFALLTLFLVLTFSRIVDRKISVETIILTGIIFSSFLGAVISLMIALSGEELRQIVVWLMGSVSMRGWTYVYMILPFTFIGALILILNSKELNALSFGEETAYQLGVDVAKRKLFILIGASLLTGSAVAISGTIGFVGLVIPHITRMLWGPNHFRLLPLAMLNGGSFLILADLVSRTIIAPQELPIGVITSIIGAPVFAFIFFNRNRKR
ncbi:ABC-type Fe3+-siderophore transport system, permease component [Schinkia azotoformans MEV2011]|uniref:ABC-type Fe3+-siderophore transport system, permease component n=1 Tax=Schinkia azotoformans MEV2011 TaxID=1348973 RepID=A0A072NSB7_SCHAZ|nr:iron ABC transporter permease [Schinkia azotoformans]KEF40589.1 ABC-type Fe3+-siderophore transport system, permease component [Schinkia azotoformans MEV2011]MEC1696005.1 iron ABC transporter permease [Schinkia azotoformans]MEC1716781.1 iron ABC transporter permease [Schinkia azotoformans]MEC1725491.1 iron ABC transporter permease [Schinkia azotoformans]MEC1739620.1 iron ABC transporter permease [Schinkia azotoformans]